MIPWSKKKVLVTGAGGFIGSHLVERLVAEGVRVRAFVRYNSRADIGLLRLLPPETLAGVEIIAGDLRDLQTVREIVRGCRVVFHLGALISIPYSYKHPGEVAETNFMGTLNILSACREAGVERLVHTSTSEVYGTARTAPIDEAHPLQAQSPYAASKIGADKLVESFHRTYRLPAVTVRPFNTYGPGQSARAVIPAVITQALVGRTVRLGNLAATRDFTYVSDTVDGFIKAAGAEGVEGETFNLGAGREISIGELAQTVIQKVGRPVEIVVDRKRLRPETSEVERLLSNNALARRRLGWRPAIDLDRGLDLTISWIREHLDLYRVGKYEF